MAEILRQRARHYPNCSKMVKQVEKMQRFYKDLQPSVKRYTHDNGHSEDLANLNGTIPAYYKGKQYNFPIEIWLYTSFPESAPLVFVRPTSTMNIRQGRHVDANGKVYLPYLNEWSASRSNLNGLIGVLATCFGSDPPVVARSSTAPPARPPQPTAYPPHSSSSAGYPAGPPSSGGYWGAQNNSGYPSQPPSYPVPTSGAGYPPSNGYPPNSSAGGYPPPAYPPSSGAGGYQPYPPSSGGYPSQPSQGPTPYPPAPKAYGGTQGNSNYGRSDSDTIAEDVILMSIRDSTNDILKRRFADVQAQSKSEVDTLKSTESELKHGKSKLDAMMGQIESERASCEDELRRCQRMEEEMDRELQSLEESQEINPEEIITPSNPIYKQIFTHHNKEQAIEDAIYFLNKALLRGSIDADTFLRTVRQLSRQQFEHKTIVIKARKRANLA
ncbi:Oidioi.mRNA.OKI2018_I69.PAR.g9052.t1.cds [Oikopleura dioica]|uniref:Oidioi.mRNA.OKI2018_I69.PAR.g9052.t1.cds n=1 Tax=Oikopleura dioica TaxID=34765 RepID=A0ABN7RM82_OIKDI|nr:Oidioi.mRNA.OKI2018_I69.PAR.g9052.t1.cds [Oikopleura dioica]